LKWDNNLWLNCDRSGHGHGTSDGNFTQVKGLYQVLATLRARYPDLIIENVSGGGNRLDLGMTQFSDVAWVSDRTSPSVHVRHNLEGLTAVFPPAYLLSFVIDDGEEPLHRAADMPLLFRSRMLGALGLSFRNEGFADWELSIMSSEIATYKARRATLGAASGSLLTAQAASGGGAAWDVLQERTAAGDQLLVTAVQTDAGVNRINIRPTGLQAETTYEVWSVDSGPLGTATGADLMANGIDISKGSLTSAHLLSLTAAPSSSSASGRTDRAQSSNR
jgi:alpha-galactosidase